MCTAAKISCFLIFIFFQFIHFHQEVTCNVSGFGNRRRSFNLLYFSNYVSEALSVTTTSQRVPSFRVRAPRVWPLSLGTLSRYPISTLDPGVCQRQRLERKSSSVMNFDASLVSRRCLKMSLRERDFCQSAGQFF